MGLSLLLGMACVSPSPYESMYAAGEYKKAMELATQDPAAKKDCESRLYIGRSLARLGDEKGAHEQYRLVIDDKPNNKTLFKLAIAAAEIRSRDLVVKCFDALRTSEPSEAIRLMNDSKVAPVLVPEGIQIFTLGKRPAPITRLRLKRPPFLPSQGESMIQVIQDPEGRPVKFRCLSGDKTLFDYDAFLIVQWSYRGAPDQLVGSYGAWSYKAEVMTQTRIETKVVTTNGPF